MIINTFSFTLVSYHKRNLNLALLNFIIMLKDFSPTLHCKSFNFSYGSVKKKVYTLVKAHHIHKKVKSSFSIIKYKSHIKFNLTLPIKPFSNNRYNNSGIYNLFLISEYVKLLIRTSSNTPYVYILLDRELLSI